MFKRTSILAALLIICLVSGASAATDLFTIGTTQKVVIDANAKIIGLKVTPEEVTANTTVTAAESGKVFLPNISSGTVTFTLPTAAEGLQYQFTSINGHVTAGQGKVILSPQDTDTFYGCVSSTTTSTFTAGDDLDSPEDTGDSVTIVGAAGKWYCTDRLGTWVDGN